MPAASSACLVRSLSLTSVLVLPRTVIRSRRPSGFQPTVIVPVQRSRLRSTSADYSASRGGGGGGTGYTFDAGGLRPVPGSGSAGEEARQLARGPAAYGWRCSPGLAIVLGKPGAM